MGKCDHCGNEYDKTFEIRMDSQTGNFDSFECAIQAMAPQCPQCGVRIVGHGVEAGNDVYCCAHCARRQGERGLSDRA